MPEPAIGSESTEWGTEGGIVDPRSVDEYPIENSRNLVRSGGVFDAIQASGGGDFPVPTELDFSEWDNGFFSETMENMDVFYYLVEFDGSNRPIKIYDETHECTVVWQ